jgi:hypothetical protein
MPDISGNSSPKRLFGAIDLSGSLSVGRFLWLVSAGVAIVALEAAFRWPLQLPGHHGIEAMALLALARLSCRHPVSASISGASAALAAPLFGADHGPLMPLFYLLPAVLLDLGWRLRPRFGGLLLFVPLLTAVAFASKPVVRVLANAVFGMQFGSLRSGPVYPILTHLLFGFVGGLAAVLLWRATERASREDSPPSG